MCAFDKDLLGVTPQVPLKSSTICTNVRDLAIGFGIGAKRK
jgi:hypothetical protein